MKGLVIGRFQPVGLNHTEMLARVDEMGLEELVLGIGTTQSGFRNAKNPFSFDEIAEILYPVASAMKTPVRIFKIPDLNDPPNYAEHVEKITGCDTEDYFVISGNRYTLDCFTEHGKNYRTISIPPQVKLNQGYLCASDIRDLILNDGPWQQYVPESTKKVIEKYGISKLKEILMLKPDEEMVYQGHVKLKRKLHDGKMWDVVQSKNACAIMYIDPYDNVWFVKQYRVPVGKEVLELPAETMDKPGKSSLEVITEGLEEECGIRISPEQIKYFTTIGSSEGHDSEYVDLYYASGPYNFVGQRLEESENIQVVKIPFEKAYKMFQTGELQGSKTVTLLQMEYIKRLEKSKDG